MADFCGGGGGGDDDGVATDVVVASRLAGVGKGLTRICGGNGRMQ